MFRYIYNLVTGGALSQPAVATSSSSSAKSSQTQQATRLSNLERLENIGYKNEIPHPFEDPITFQIMDKPCKLNGLDAQIMDKSTIFQCQTKESHEFLNPFTRLLYPSGIIAVETDDDLQTYKKRYEANSAQLIQVQAAYYTPHSALERIIDRFVSTLEALHLQLNHLHNLLCPIDHDLISQFDNVSHNMVTQYIEQQQCERVDTIQKTKQMIIDVLINFILETDSVINKVERTSHEIAKSKHQILTGPQLLQNLLIAELQHLASLPASARYAKAIVPSEYYSTLAFKPVAAEVQESINQRITSLADVSLTIKLQTENEIPQAPPASARVQFPRFSPCLTVAEQLNSFYYHRFLAARRKLIQSREQLEQGHTTAQAAASARTAATASAAAAASVAATPNETDTTHEAIRPAAPRSPSLRRSYVDDVD